MATKKTSPDLDESDEVAEAPETETGAPPRGPGSMLIEKAKRALGARKDPGFHGSVAVLEFTCTGPVTSHLAEMLALVKGWIADVGWQWETDRLPIKLRVAWAGPEPKLGEQNGVAAYLATKGFPIHATSFHRHDG